MVICFFSGVRWGPGKNRETKLFPLASSLWGFQWFSLGNWQHAEVDQNAQDGCQKWGDPVGPPSWSSVRLGFPTLACILGWEHLDQGSWSAWHLWEIGWFSGMCGKRLDQTISWITFVMQSCGGPIFGFQLPHPGVVPSAHDAHDCYLPTASAFIDPSFGGFKRLCCWFSQTSHLQKYEVWVNFITQFLKGHLFQEIWSTINLLQEYVLCPEMAIFEDKSWQKTGVFEVPKGPLWSFG